MALTQAQVASILDVTARRVRQMHQEGKGPPQNAEGQYEEGAFGRWIREQAADLSGGYNYEAERARLTHEQANKVALEVAELRGELVRSSEVGPYWSDMVASMRGKLVSLPSKLSALIADVVLRGKLQAQSEALVYEALAEIEKDGLPAAARERFARSAGKDGAQPGEAAAEADAESVG